MKKVKKNKLNFNFIATFYLVLIFTVISTASIFFLIGGSINNHMFIFDYLLSILIMYGIYNKKEDNKIFIKNTIVATIIFFTLCSISLIFYDVSWDGNVYHKQMIGLMKNGMNPVYNKISGDIWTRHYANAAEIWGAVLYAFFNNIEAGKVINLLLSFSLYVFSFKYVYKKTNRKVISNLFSVALAFNPILINQFHSYYIDGIVGASMFLVILGLLNVIDGKQNFGDKENYVVLATSIVICINSKFTALLLCIMFVCLLGGYTTIYNFIKKNFEFMWKYILYIFIVFVFGVFVGGSSTYVKNYVNNGHPFYPLMGEGAVDIETGNEPESFKNMNHVEKWLYATFSETYTWYDENPKLKIPFSVSKSEMNSLNYPDIRIGGLGVWFSGMLLISIVVIVISMIVLFIKKSEYFWIAGLLLAGIIIPIPVLPVVWQARYYPEIYLLPFIAMIFLMIPKKKIFRVLSYVLVLMAIGNSMFLIPQVWDKLRYSIEVNRTLVYLAEESQTKKVIMSQDNYTFYGAYYNYLDKNIKYEYENKRMENGIPIYHGSLYRIEEEKE